MLRQETAGYALGKRPPWGSCIMELKNGKGRLHLTMQGLKPRGYDVYVMAGEESVFCGEVYPEKKEGRCELKWDFDPDDIGDRKKAEDIHTVLVLADDHAAPLTAYFKEKKDWKQDFQPIEQEKIILRAAEAAVLEQPMVALEKKEELQDINTEVAQMQKESYHGSFQGLLAKFRQELEDLEETGILSYEETEQIRNIGRKPDVKNQEKTEEVSEKNLFASNPAMSPFGDGKVWKRLSLEELTLLSQIPLRWQKEFFFLLPWRKYQHLIFREDAEGVWLCLPQQYDERDRKDAETFGFAEFHPVNGDWGYWICFLQRNG